MFNTPKDVLLLAEAYDKVLMNDDEAAKRIAEKIKGTPNLSVPTIKQYVAKYLEMVGKNPTDVDYIAANVYDILHQQGLVESKKSMKKKPDYMDLDKDSNKKESMKKAAKDDKKMKKIKKESLTFRELYASVING